MILEDSGILVSKKLKRTRLTQVLDAFLQNFIDFIDLDTIFWKKHVSFHDFWGFWDSCEFQNVDGRKKLKRKRLT